MRVAKIVVSEPQEEVRELLLRVVARLGHEGLAYGSEHDLDGAGALLLEPAAAEAAEAASVARACGVPVVCVSIYPPSDETRALEPVAFLHKPFAIVDLERAIVEALAHATPLAAVS